MCRLLVVGLVALALPPAAALATSSANDAAASASKGCVALRTSIGEAPFGQAFSSFGACVTLLAPLELRNSSAASASCRTERADLSFAAAHAGKKFAAFYRSGRAHGNAFGNCVARKARASAAAERASTMNPSRCADVEASMGASAFTACVSAAARAQIATQVTAASACARERADAGFAAAHGGKTFDLYYGTSATLANAYGRCVAQKTQAAATAQPQTQPIPLPPGDGGVVPDRCGGTQSGGLDGAATGSPKWVPRPESADCPVA
jgi:hypothetical protein